jgi:hypothetical protein
MDAQAKESFIRKKARENEQSLEGAKVLWSRHAITEMIADDLDRGQIERSWQTCELIEDYPSVHRPLPDCLVLSWLTPCNPLHAVVAMDVEQDRLLVVTVYRPNDKEWENDWRTRKS